MIPTTIQTIKEAEERRRVTFSETPHDKNSILQAVPYWSLEEYVTQTLLAVFESELESVPEDETDGSKLGYENSPEIYGNQRLEAMKKGINQERANRRSHLTEVINYLKQK